MYQLAEQRCRDFIIELIRQAKYRSIIRNVFRCRKSENNNNQQFSDREKRKHIPINNLKWANIWQNWSWLSNSNWKRTCRLNYKKKWTVVWNRVVRRYSNWFQWFGSCVIWVCGLYYRKISASNTTKS